MPMSVPAVTVRDLTRRFGAFLAVDHVSFDVEPGTTPHDLIERFSLPINMCHLVLVDGRFIPPAERATRTLIEGETLAIWPPVAGG